MSRLIIAQALVETSTPTSDHMIAVFAFFTFSSSPDDVKYIIHATTKASTDNTATYSIEVDIRFPKNEKKLSLVRELSTSHTPLLLHPGRPLQTTPGEEANVFIFANILPKNSIFIMHFITSRLKYKLFIENIRH